MDLSASSGRLSVWKLSRESYWVQVGKRIHVVQSDTKRAVTNRFDVVNCVTPMNIPEKIYKVAVFSVPPGTVVSMGCCFEASIGGGSVMPSLRACCLV
jgi:hypothetical protein